MWHCYCFESGDSEPHRNGKYHWHCHGLRLGESHGNWWRYLCLVGGQHAYYGCEYLCGKRHLHRNGDECEQLYGNGYKSRNGEHRANCVYHWYGDGLRDGESDCNWWRYLCLVGWQQREYGC